MTRASLCLMLALSGCAPTSAPGPHFAEAQPAETAHKGGRITPLGVVGLVSLGIFTVGAAATLILVVPQTSAGG